MSLARSEDRMTSETVTEIRIEWARAACGVCVDM